LTTPKATRPGENYSSRNALASWRTRRRLCRSEADAALSTILKPLLEHYEDANVFISNPQ
jgi:hypothetical protein